MTERDGFSGTHMLLAILGGAATGAAVALLAAPRSGRETRAQISDFVTTGTNRARSVPPAVKAASTAARDAFVEAMRAEA